MSLQKPLLALLLLTIASSVSSTTCGSNPLLAISGITASFSDAQVVSGLNYCKSLQNKETCCDAATINNFQAKTDNLLSELKADVSKRDQSLIRIRTHVLPSLSSELNTLKDLANKVATNLQAHLDAGGSGNYTSDLKTSFAISLASGLAETARSLTDDISTLKSNFPLYQNARSACVIEMVKTQAAAWCLACDPEYTSKGVSGSGIALSDTLVQTLTGTCYAYLTDSSSQSAVFSLNLMKNYLQNFTDVFTNVVTYDSSAPIEQLTAWVLDAFLRMEDSVYSPDNASLPIQFPSDCESSGCNWIATTLFKGGQLSETILALGGAVQTESVESRLQEIRVNGRMLGTSWSPDSDEAGVSVTFEDNPGNVDNNSNSGVLFKGVMGGLVVLLSVLLI